MIRLATPEDLPKILAIYETARCFMVQTGNPNQWANGYPPESRIRQDIAEGKCHLYLENQEILAVFYFAQEEDPTYRHIQGAWHWDGPYGVIHRLAVAKPGRGGAEACFRYAESRCGCIRIDTHRDNLPMQRCLEKRNYRLCGEIYLEDGDPRIAFEKVTEYGERIDT